MSRPNARTPKNNFEKSRKRKFSLVLRNLLLSGENYFCEPLNAKESVPNSNENNDLCSEFEFSILSDKLDISKIQNKLRIFVSEENLEQNDSRISKFCHLFSLIDELSDLAYKTVVVISTTKNNTAIHIRCFGPRGVSLLGLKGKLVVTGTSRTIPSN